jgi:hypothetical protein
MRSSFAPCAYFSPCAIHRCALHESELYLLYGPAAQFPMGDFLWLLAWLRFLALWLPPLKFRQSYFQRVVKHPAKRSFLDCPEALQPQNISETYPRRDVLLRCRFDNFLFVHGRNIAHCPTMCQANNNIIRIILVRRMNTGDFFGEC